MWSPHRGAVGFPEGNHRKRAFREIKGGSRSLLRPSLPVATGQASPQSPDSGRGLTPPARGAARCVRTTGMKKVVFGDPLPQCLWGVHPERGTFSSLHTDVTQARRRLVVGEASPASGSSQADGRDRAHAFLRAVVMVPSREMSLHSLRSLALELTKSK